MILSFPEDFQAEQPAESIGARLQPLSPLPLSLDVSISCLYVAKYLRIYGCPGKIILHMT